MNVLAIETSTEWLSLALGRGEARHERRLLAGQRHAEIILDEIEGLLRAAELDVSSLDGIAFGAGPGSFTGLRIACGVAQGLAAAAALPVLGIGCLAALAQASGAERIVACLDARMGEVYHAAFLRERPDRLREVISPQLSRPQEVSVPDGEGWLGCGSGFAVHGDALALRLGHHLAAIRADLRPDARALLEIALPRFAAGEGGDAADALPLYLRDRVALTRAERGVRQ